VLPIALFLLVRSDPGLGSLAEGKPGAVLVTIVLWFAVRTVLLAGYAFLLHHQPAENAMPAGGRVALVDGSADQDRITRSKEQPSDAQPRRAGRGQLEIRYPVDSEFLPVELKEIILVSIKREAGISRIVSFWIREAGIMEEFIPGFSSLPPPEWTNMSSDSETGASEVILETGIKGCHNTVVIPSMEYILPYPIPGMPTIRFALGLLTSVPDGKQPQVFLVEAVGTPKPSHLQGIVRITKKQTDAD